MYATLLRVMGGTYGFCTHVEAVEAVEAVEQSERMKGDPLPGPGLRFCIIGPFGTMLYVSRPCVE